MSFREFVQPKRPSSSRRSDPVAVLVRVSRFRGGRTALKLTIGRDLAKAAKWSAGQACALHVGADDDAGRVRISRTDAAHGSALRKLGTLGTLALSFAEVPEFGSVTQAALPAACRLVGRGPFEIEVEMPTACLSDPALLRARGRREEAEALALAKEGAETDLGGSARKTAARALPPARVAEKKPPAPAVPERRAPAPPAHKVGEVETVAMAKGDVRLTFAPTAEISRDGHGRIVLSDHEALFLRPLVRSLECCIPIGKIVQGSGREMPSATALNDLMVRLPRAGLKLTYVKAMGWTLAKD